MILIRLIQNFLSCLYGRARSDEFCARQALFLSCLYGRAQGNRRNWLALRFLSCLYGRALNERIADTVFGFLSCLYGRALDFDDKRLYKHVSKLPVRQSTYVHILFSCPLVSKLPVRQSTYGLRFVELTGISKLPVRQSTEIISPHPSDLHTKKAKKSSLTLFFTHQEYSFKINKLHKR